MRMKDKVKEYLRASYSGLAIKTTEELRATREVLSAVEELSADDRKIDLCSWDALNGLRALSTDEDNPAGVCRMTLDAGLTDPLDMLNHFRGVPDDRGPLTVILHDFHLYLEDTDPLLIRTIKECLAIGRERNMCLLFMGCRQVIPPELEREITTIQFDLPTEGEIGTLLDTIAQATGLPAPEGPERQRVIDAAKGLGSLQVADVISLAVIRHRGFNAEAIGQEKALEVQKSGALELVDTSTNLDDIGGLATLKKWLVQRRETCTDRAVEFGLPTPRGVLILGIPGTGKSLTAKATAAILGRPLLRLDAGSLYSSLLGRTEEAIREVIATVEAISPCILWIDELEKAVAGSRSSGQSDGGTSARVFGTLLSWLQEKTSPVFVVATANDVSQLPPELLRKGRFDELFFVDLPTPMELESIWAIQLKKFFRDPADYNLTRLASRTAGFTGAEVEQVVIDALYAAFGDRGVLQEDHLIAAAAGTKPLSETMAEQVTALQTWAKGRAKPASRSGEDSRTSVSSTLGKRNLQGISGLN